MDASLIDWSRAQFAMTAAYHWIFVPLTLGLSLIMAVAETVYYRTGKPEWKKYAKFWIKLFAVNFAVGIATGLILEFEFGTNWSNYSWFVGDIFGAPLAIEGIAAFFMEAAFVVVMLFGWKKVSRGFHLASTWLVFAGATLSAWWILVANAWMQDPVGVTFNPDTMRNEMTDFAAVALSPVAVNKFFHTVFSAWILGSAFVIGVSCWFLLKKRNVHFSVSSIKIAGWTGIVAAILSVVSGDGSAFQVSDRQPMKLASMEALYDGGNGVGLIALGAPYVRKTGSDTTEGFYFKLNFPQMLSVLATRNINGYVPGINDILKGGYELPDGRTALSAKEKMRRGRKALDALAEYHVFKKSGDEKGMLETRDTLLQNMRYFGYGYIKDPAELVPDVPLLFYSFRIMVILGIYFILFFIYILAYAYRENRFATQRGLQRIGVFTLPLAYIAGMAGWVVAEVGRQPWAIQDLLPVSAASSNLDVASVKLSFFIFLLIFTVLFIAATGIMLNIIRKGPEDDAGGVVKTIK